MSEFDYSLTNSDLGDRLRKLRTAAGMGPSQLSGAVAPYLAGAPQARQGFLPREAINRIEIGRRALKYSEAVAIAKALGVDTAAFTSEAACEAAVRIIKAHKEAS
ncbi:helix-turn-helix domain-containing protein [Gordonia bronchialis]|uniref:helix-turn-helix domain-containing protein n=1 Tax=Gordonia bronchialis TaxID=2054 RepID=UPI001CBBB27C|nr:helix-turn-helix transcriptional regulator [Gordonia bronchialis]UAK38377.1 helix-turn-helix domain-containing protein [Gordonia bronchialis]